MIRLIMAIATGLGAGCLPKAPGTWGSAVGLLIYYLLHTLQLSSYLFAVGILLIVGTFTAGSAEKILDRKDPGSVVIDEIVGMLITLTTAPAEPLIWLLGFLVFRFFDIVKPFPVGWIDKNLHGGLGIMLDDVMAGFYSLLVLQGMLQLRAFM
jgi:phosphatidylglycerophosphatase A